MCRNQNQAIRPDRLILISTHQVRDLELLIDAVMILDDKKLALCETASKLLSQLSKSSENTQIVSYEARPVPRYKFFLILAFLF